MSEHPKTSPVTPEAVSAPDSPAVAANGGDDDLFERVQKVVDIMRPAVQADNGDLMLRGVDAGTGIVEVELMGACVTCPASSQTLKAGVERILRDRVPEVTEVVNIGETLEEIGGTPVSL